ncbi:carbamoyltransferase HypF [Fervidicoccus fontis]|uniref:Carbamoyltransferase n=1 Tax=Fervidicoccus fontis TaxID=683846 RepID=A0A843AEE8_9CREN|nr:carbamoyltransferase HypF [Fervidicoccus fontis]MBE9391446.1 carbamoyltransferase HypF [Fervidicoccus fontis]
MKIAHRIKIVGVVQGVGFRPFVYRLATNLNLFGYVVNKGGAEVEIFIEGEKRNVEKFTELLEKEKPPPAIFEEISISNEEPKGFTEFKILKSKHDFDKRSMIPPDIGICDNCLSEIRSPSSRFYKYHWNSCAWCGPRFSMMYSVPYDRENTSMEDFPLCKDCECDYKDVSNLRRFHAQGISCPVCGPKTIVIKNDGTIVKTEEDPVDFSAKMLLEGKILAIKGVGGYHIASIASDDKVVRKLRKIKNRPSQPFAIMAKDIETVKTIAYLDEIGEKIILSPQRPILILPKRDSSKVSELVAPGLSTIGIMLPYTGFQHLLLEKIPDGFLIMTSGNIHGRPMCKDLECALNELGSIVDFIIEHERKIVHRVDDSVIRFTDGEPVFLRRSRGYAPLWISSPFELKEIVALGAELQTAGAVSFENKIIPTQFIGDLDDIGTLEDLERELEWFIKTYEIKPKAIAIDMHPLYKNRKLAHKLKSIYGAEIIEVQHHHSHLASLMVEQGYKIDEKAVGIAIDGIGYSPNGEIWGGEALIASYEGFYKLGGIMPFCLSGGDSASVYPVKSLISILSSVLDEEELIEVLRRRELLASLPYGEEEARITYTLSRNGKCFKCSSIGRVIDAISVLLKASYLRSYEGEPAIKLEALADKAKKGAELNAPIVSNDGMFFINTTELILNIIDHLDSVDSSELALGSLIALGRAFGHIAVEAIKGKRNLRGEILVSGGASVNTYLIRGIKEEARVRNIDVKINRKLPPGDGGIAVGQIAVASSKI